MAKGIPEKCKKCAMLSAAQAQELHGNDGDRCWNPNVCHRGNQFCNIHFKAREKLKICRSQFNNQEKVIKPSHKK